MTGGDHMPSAWRKDGGGIVLKTSLRTITIVVSVIPIFFWAPPYILSVIAPGRGNQPQTTHKYYSKFTDVNPPTEEI